jgi:hypothetical protein
MSAEDVYTTVPFKDYEWPQQYEWVGQFLHRVGQLSRAELDAHHTMAYIVDYCHPCCCPLFYTHLCTLIGIVQSRLHLSKQTLLLLIDKESCDLQFWNTFVAYIFNLVLDVTFAPYNIPDRSGSSERSTLEDLFQGAFHASSANNSDKLRCTFIAFLCGIAKLDFQYYIIKDITCVSLLDCDTDIALQTFQDNPKMQYHILQMLLHDTSLFPMQQFLRRVQLGHDKPLKLSMMTLDPYSTVLRFASTSFFEPELSTCTILFYSLPFADGTRQCVEIFYSVTERFWHFERRQNSASRPDEFDIIDKQIGWTSVDC